MQTTLSQIPAKKIKNEIHGFILLDKPVGMSSNKALQKVKRALNAKKAGHTGTLDPEACGLLVLCLGDATKFSQYLLDANKRYLTTATLGVQTTTGDAEGEIVAEKAVPDFNPQQIENVLAQFRGDITQIPSMYSALKHEGRPLYEWARQGIEIQRPARTITIHELSLTGMTVDSLDLDVRCSKGTYIRTLVEDIGHALGCGAHVSYLRRTEVGRFSLENLGLENSEWVNSGKVLTLSALENVAANPSTTVEEILNEYLLPLDAAFLHWPILELPREVVTHLRHGKPFVLSDLSAAKWSRVYCEGKFIGLAEVVEGEMLKIRRWTRE